MSYSTIWCSAPRIIGFVCRFTTYFNHVLNLRNPFCSSWLLIRSLRFCMQVPLQPVKPLALPTSPMNPWCCLDLQSSIRKNSNLSEVKSQLDLLRPKIMGKRLQHHHFQPWISHHRRLRNFFTLDPFIQHPLTAVRFHRRAFPELDDTPVAEKLEFAGWMLGPELCGEVRKVPTWSQYVPVTSSYIIWLAVWNHGILWLSIQLGMSSS